MQAYKNRFMITRRILSIPLNCLLCFIAISGIALGRQIGDGRDGWMASVKDDSLAVYSRMSTKSRIVKTLEKGSLVRIDLEIIGADGAWCSVAVAGQKVSSGYVRSEGLERMRPATPTLWRAQPPVNRPAQSSQSDLAQQKEQTGSKPVTSDEIAKEVARILESKLDRSALVKGSDQTTAQEPVGFDHRSTFGLVFPPKGFGKRTPIFFFPGSGAFCDPFLPIRPITPIGGHVKMGNPLRRR